MGAVSFGISLGSFENRPWAGSAGLGLPANVIVLEHLRHGGQQMPRPDTKVTPCSCWLLLGCLKVVLCRKITR